MRTPEGRAPPLALRWERPAGLRARRFASSPVKGTVGFLTSIQHTGFRTIILIVEDVIWPYGRTEKKN
ncbi:unnamed protein product [Caretta caretta]